MFVSALGPVTIRRHDLTVRWPAALADAAELIPHPYLALPAAIVQHWLGASSFHAAAVGDGNRCVVIGGDKGGGKSTLAAACADAGMDVLTDDLTVMTDGVVHPGPRTVDLRTDAAQLFDTVLVDVAGHRPRHRVRLENATALPVAGFVHLRWGTQLGLDEVTGSARLAALGAWTALQIPPLSPAAHLDLATLPAWQLTRPQGDLGAAAISGAVEAVATCLAACG